LKPKVSPMEDPDEEPEDFPHGNPPNWGPSNPSYPQPLMPVPNDVNAATKNLMSMLSEPPVQPVGQTDTAIAMADLGLDMQNPETFNSIAKFSSLDKNALAYITNSLRSVPNASRQGVLSILSQVLA